MRKYQEGGQLSDTQQQGLQYLAQMYAQQTGKDPQEDQEGFMQFIQQLAQQAGVEDIGQLLDMIYQQAAQQAQSARRGAKLNYLKSLTGRCPEGTELMYFKAGGRVCSKCVAKKNKGKKLVKAQGGLKEVKPYQYKKRPNNDMMKIGSNTNTSELSKKLVVPYEYEQKGKNRGEVYKNFDPKVINGNLRRRFPSLSKDFKKDGGSLNRIPFNRPGGLFNKIGDYLSSPSKYYNDVERNNVIQRTWNNGEVTYIANPKDNVTKQNWTTYIHYPNRSQKQLKEIFFREGNNQVSLPTVTVTRDQNARMNHYNPFSSGEFKNGGSL